MVDRQEVEELLALVEAEKGRWSPHVPAPTLTALCRAWLAVQNAPVALMGMDCVLYGNPTPLVALNGQRVRIVKEVNKEPSIQTQEIQKEEDPFDSWFAEHYPDIDKLGKDDPMAAGFRHAMRGSFNSK